MNLSLVALLVLLWSRETAGFQRSFSGLSVTGHNMQKTTAETKAFCFQSQIPSHYKRLSVALSASETSFGFRDMLSTHAGSRRQTFQSIRDSNSFVDAICNQAILAQKTTKTVTREAWWLSPMLLALIPIYSALCLGTCAAMPEWWKVVNMENIRQSREAMLVIHGFLLSNIAYFASGIFLLARFPVRSVRKRNALFPLVKPSEFSMLGVWILLAGGVSTVFHSVQALGSHTLSESLCYIDHAVAISAAFYFFKTCGFPSRRVWTIGVASLMALLFSDPAYALIHSAWHFLSATTATLWALDGHRRHTSEWNS